MAASPARSDGWGHVHANEKRSSLMSDNPLEKTPDMANLTPAERARIYKERAAAAGLGRPPAAGQDGAPPPAPAAPTPAAPAPAERPAAAVRPAGGGGAGALTPEQRERLAAAVQRGAGGGAGGAAAAA